MLELAALGDARDIDERLPGELGLHARQGLLPVGVSQRFQHLAFAGESAVKLRAEDEQEAACFEKHFPGADAGRIVAPGPHLLSAGGQRLQDAEPIGAGDAHTIAAIALTQPPAASGGNDPCRLLFRTAAGNAADEPQQLRAGRFQLQPQVRLIGLHLGEALDPADRQLDFLLDDFLTVDFQGERLRADGEAGLGLLAQAGQAGSQGRVEIDIGRAAALDAGVERVRAQIDASIHAAAAAEPLQPQDVVGASHHGVEHGRPRQEEMRSHDC